jgi:2-methylcitrate dehydratase PrpD
VDYTKRVANFVVVTNLRTILPKALEVAKTAILDCIRVTLAGSKEECA